MNEQWRSRITIEPGKRGGRPCIRGMRITVYDVLSYLAAGMTIAEILDDFPYLTPEDIQACLAFAAERDRSMFARREFSPVSAPWSRFRGIAPCDRGILHARWIGCLNSTIVSAFGELLQQSKRRIYSTSFRC